MKHIFIMNPAAGKGKAGKVFLPKIIETSKRLGIDYEIHRTLAPGDALHFVKSRCEAARAGDEPGAAGSEETSTMRFYACGGDGTLNEVANGAFGCAKAEIAMIPAGTGNDFPRYFGKREYFEDIERQILGEARTIDLIRYASDSEVRYCVNMFNIGLDCNVADKVAEIKDNPFVPAPIAYGLGVGIILLKKEGVTLEISLDNGEAFSGDLMLVAIGNASYCGGGFKGVPGADVADGLIDVSIVGNISRRTFLSLLGKYRKGTHLEDPVVKIFLTYRKCKSLTIKPQGMMKLCTDGEITMMGETTFTIEPACMKFSVPQGCV